LTHQSLLKEKLQLLFVLIKTDLQSCNSMFLHLEKIFEKNKMVIVEFYCKINSIGKKYVILIVLIYK
jgi:hypothetical protein